MFLSMPSLENNLLAAGDLLFFLVGLAVDKEISVYRVVVHYCNFEKFQALSFIPLLRLGKISSFLLYRSFGTWNKFQALVCILALCDFEKFEALSCIVVFRLQEILSSSSFTIGTWKNYEFLLHIIFI